MIADVYRKIKWFDPWEKKYISGVICGVYDNGYKVSNYGGTIPFEDLKFKKNQASPFELNQKIKYKNRIWRIDCLQGKYVLLINKKGFWIWVRRELLLQNKKIKEMK